MTCDGSVGMYVHKHISHLACLLPRYMQCNPSSLSRCHRQNPNARLVYVRQCLFYLVQKNKH